MVGICVKMFCRFAIFFKQYRYRNLVYRSFPSLNIESQIFEPGEEFGKNDITSTVLELGTYRLIVRMGVYLISDILETCNNI